MYSVESASASATTKLEIETFSYRWDILDFQNIYYSLKTKESPQFVGGQHSWCLRLEKTTENGEKFLGLYLRLKKFDPNRKDDDKKVVVSFQFNALDEYDDSRHEMGGPSQYCNFIRDKNRTLGYKKFLRKTDCYFMINIASMNALRIFCRVWVQKGEKTICRALEQKNAIKTSSKMQISDDFKKLLKEGTFHDIVLSTGSQEFKAHKCILSARSSVFATMLNTDMEESSSNVIHIDDFSGDTIKEMLNYLYHGEVENMKTNCLELLRIGDKYDIQGLVNASAEASSGAFGREASKKEKRKINYTRFFDYVFNKISN